MTNKQFEFLNKNKTFNILIGERGYGKSYFKRYKILSEMRILFHKNKFIFNYYESITNFLCILKLNNTAKKPKCFRIENKIIDNFKTHKEIEEFVRERIEEFINE